MPYRGRLETVKRGYEESRKTKIQVINQSQTGEDGSMMSVVGH